jgi:hypothetical protein
MPQHVIMHYIQDLPDGYDSYSLLLIPHWQWLKKAGIHQSFNLFSHFTQFGKDFDTKHLAVWFYKGFIGSYENRSDLEVLSAIYGRRGSDEDIRKFVIEQEPRIKRKGEQEQRDYVQLMTGYYDVDRARYFCACYRLDFKGGPYIAFFKEKPVVPSVIKVTGSSPGMAGYRIPEEGRATKPVYVLKFGGLGVDRVQATLNEIENELFLAKPILGRLTLRVVGEYISDYCQQNSHKIGKTIKFIKDVEQAVPSPAIKDVINY